MCQAIFGVKVLNIREPYKSIMVHYEKSPPLMTMGEHNDRYLSCGFNGILMEVSSVVSKVKLPLTCEEKNVPLAIVDEC